MSIEDVAKSLLTEVVGPDVKPPAAGVEDGSIDAEKERAKLKQSDPRKADPEEVQYPGYLKDGGSL